MMAGVCMGNEKIRVSNIIIITIITRCDVKYKVYGKKLLD